MFGFGFFATAASVVAGGAIATVTVIGVVNHSVESPAKHSGDVSKVTQLSYGKRVS